MVQTHRWMNRQMEKMNLQESACSEHAIKYMYNMQGLSNKMTRLVYYIKLATFLLHNI